jgi:hypothetical protein
MIRLLAAVAALLPAAAFAQLGALEHARGAGRTSDEGNARIERAADAQLEQGDRGAATGQPAAEGEAAPPPGELAIPGDEGALDVGVEGSAQVEPGRGGAVPPPDTYTIRPGDTLWDLSGRFLNNPWYWPKIWSYNPEITNPHWIYPGNLLRFYPSTEEGPARVEPLLPVAGAEGAPQDALEEDEDLVAPRELEDLSKADLAQPPSAEERDAVGVSGPYKIGHVSGRAQMARRDSFVTPRELAESGEITAAFEEKLMLATLDKAYARFSQEAPVKAGETYVVYRTAGDVRHPVTGELIGYQSVVLGAARVVAIDERAASLVIVQANDVIERGAMLGPWTDKFFRRVEATPNGQALAGVIVGPQTRVVTQIGEQQVVYVDRGERDGVREGNVFTVVRAGDLYGKPADRPVWDESLPKEDVGQLLVVDVKERASTALVTRSVKELYVGDRVELRPSEGFSKAN